MNPTPDGWVTADALVQKETPPTETITPTPEVQETAPEVITPEVKVEEVKPTPEPPKSWEDVLKEQGFGEFEIDLLKYKKTTGSVQKYLEVKSVDYDKLGPEDLLRKQIAESNPGIPPRALEFKLKEELKKFQLDPELYDEDTIAAGREALEYEANRVRNQFKEQQAKFAEPVVNREAEAARLQEEQAQQVRAYQESIKSHPSIQSLLQSKRLVLDGGKDKFNFEVSDPSAAVDLIVDSQKWQQTISNPDGTPNVGLLAEVAAFIQNRQTLYQQLINYGKTLGEKKLVEEDLHNVPQPETSAPATSQKDLFQTIADNWK